MRKTVSGLAAALAFSAFLNVAHADWSSSLQGELANALRSGNWGFALLVLFAAGFANALMPCVYPMIAITVSVFGARQTKSRAQGAALSSMFVLGMASLFTPLGLVAGLGGGFFGEALTSPVVTVLLALTFVVFAASMFGAFEMNLPPALQNRLATIGGMGYRGAFALGFVTSIIAAPCTGPVLGGLLAWISTTRNAAFGAAGLFAFSLGLGVLFWLVGTFAVTLPKSGKWLEWSKSVFGIVMVALAWFYAKKLVPGAGTWIAKENVWLGVAMVCLTGGIGIGAVHLSFHDAAIVNKIRKGAGIAITCFGAALLVLWLEALPAGAKIAWLEDYPAAKSLAEREGRPLLVDFGANWCGACGELDRHTFSDPRVVAEAQRFVPVRVDLSAGQVTDTKRQALASYRQRGLPLVVMHGGDGREVVRVTEFVEPDAFLQRMRDVR